MGSAVDEFYGQSETSGSRHGRPKWGWEINARPHYASRYFRFAFDSALATRSYAPWISRLAQEGYEFHLLFLWLNTVELAIQRVAERVRNGGHSVSDNIIRRRYRRGLENLS